MCGRWVIYREETPLLLAATRAAKAALMGKGRKWAEMLSAPRWQTGRNQLLVVGCGRETEFGAVERVGLA